MFRLSFLFTLAALLVFGIEGWAQYQSGMSKTSEPPIYIEGFNYPKFDELSHFAWFNVNFKVVKGTELQIIGEHYRRYYADRFKLGAGFRQRLNEKSNIFGGYQKEWDLYNEGRGYPNPVPREEIYFGVQHQVKENMLMDVRMVQPTFQSDFYSIGLEGVKTRLEMGTRLKF
ncbi:hypothetical protein [Flagellimonas okinawensis]|uniref:Uncharacterized protein n=1 Tax=Flagellimonas okinawensis TaxID=3031324 RepID=A0ABT5XS09_9FLAO|nr:hypothetical protein [[Muricauda] okinawensis]MDF0708673.1 hypothetical protein [[Muricauda] okinawensis]